MKNKWAESSLPTGLVDYLTLHHQLSHYANPRDKISRLIKEGSLIRVKKGLYVLAKARGILKEMLANLIYGPSYISLHYALSYYGMIPERVERVTSMTTKKNKEFSTPLGHFSYYYLSLDAYAVGIQLEIISAHEHFLMASREKALCDVVATLNNLKSPQSMRELLLEDMRIDREILRKLSLSSINEISKKYKNKNVQLLFEVLKEMK